MPHRWSRWLCRHNLEQLALSLVSQVRNLVLLLVAGLLLVVLLLHQAALEPLLAEAKALLPWRSSR